ncbi:LysR substrate-binding domain-containing protein [Salinisphaera sp. SPP-AMP-43]|uniref:LysR substrate-binding domain-containing protein n=1 Tax=Salinisphaera sp. SPP-AMP-43 TaxID=3121288 RepID=UPI003C6DBEE9
MKTTFEEHQAFVTVVDTGTVTAAAEHLGRTTSAISRALQRLENKLGADLLRRTTRRIALTDEGRLFLEQSRRVLEAIDTAEQTIPQRRGTPAGRLTINAAPVFMQYVIVPLVGEFRARFPSIELHLDTHDRIIDLLEHRADVAIRIGPLADSTLHARALGQTALRLVAAPSYLATHGQPCCPAELASHHRLGFDAMSHLNQWPLASSTGEDLTIQPSIAASSASTLLELALAGQGIACMADYTTRGHRERGALVEVLAEDRLDRRQAIHAVYYRDTAPAARVRLFLDFMAPYLPAMI